MRYVLRQALSASTWPPNAVGQDAGRCGAAPCQHAQRGRPHAPGVHPQSCEPHCTLLHSGSTSACTQPAWLKQGPGAALLCKTAQGAALAVHKCCPRARGEACVFAACRWCYHHPSGTHQLQAPPCPGCSGFSGSRALPGSQMTACRSARVHASVAVGLMVPCMHTCKLVEG